MPYVCALTGKKASFGKQRTYRGQKIVKGGFGLKPTGITRRKFRPNLQKVTALIDGSPTRIYASTKAIKSGLVIKPLKRRDGYTAALKAAAAAKA
ncbi:MAG: 50S ribosomal protein L28 [Phycisphaerales bacterium]